MSNARKQNTIPNAEQLEAIRDAAQAVCDSWWTHHEKCGDLYKAAMKAGVAPKFVDEVIDRVKESTFFTAADAFDEALRYL